MQKDLLTHIMQLSSRWPKRPFSRDFYSAVASVLALMGFCFCAMADASNVIRYAPNPPYDNIPITPKTWEEVDLIYYSTISGHRYTNAIQLLRPVAWLHKRHMDIIGSKVTLSMPEFGIVNVLATVKAIRPTRIDTRGVDWSKQKSAPVIGKFMRYVTDVRTYTFKDSLGHISHINATPNHPFYVKNKHGFVAIGNVSDKDTLVGDIRSVDNHIDSAVHLVCTKGKHSHCGAAFVENGLPIPVYNFEVYRRHVYRVGSGGVLVHNGCNSSITEVSETNAVFGPLTQEEQNILNQSNLMPEEVYLQQKSLGAITYQTSKGSIYEYNALSFKRYVSEAVIANNSKYLPGEIRSSNAAVISSLNVAELKALPLKSIGKERYKEAETYFSHFVLGDDFGLYKKIYNINGTEYSVTFDATMTSTHQFHPIDMKKTRSYFNIHLGHPII